MEGHRRCHSCHRLCCSTPAYNAAPADATLPLLLLLPVSCCCQLVGGPAIRALYCLLQLRLICMKSRSRNSCESVSAAASTVSLCLSPSRFQRQRPAQQTLETAAPQNGAGVTETDATKDDAFDEPTATTVPPATTTCSFKPHAYAVNVAIAGDNASAARTVSAGGAAAPWSSPAVC